MWEQDLEIATVRTMWLWGNEWSDSPEKVSQIFLSEGKNEGCGSLFDEGDPRCEIGTARDGSRAVCGEFGTPDGTFVAQEGADPISGPLSQHGVSILAA